MDLLKELYEGIGESSEWVLLETAKGEALEYARLYQLPGEPVHMGLIAEALWEPTTRAGEFLKEEQRQKVYVDIEKEAFTLAEEGYKEAEEQGQLEEYLQGSYEQGVFEEEMKDVMPEPPAPVLSLTTFERWVEERKKMTPEEVEDEEVAGLIRRGEMPAQYVAGVWVEPEEQPEESVRFFEEEGAISLEMDQGAFLDEMSSELW